MFSRPGTWEIVIIVILVVIIFGGRKLPELGRSLGKGITNFRNALKGNKSDSEGGEGSEGAKEGSAESKDPEKQP